jgi:hypothetical protein
VELLWSASRCGQGASDRSRSERHRSPGIAAMLALVPGLGAVYNRQNVKAFGHFIVICGLFELAELSGLGIFVVGGGVFYLYSMIDAYRTARAVLSGADPAKEDEQLRQFLQENVKTWALVLIGLGLMFLLTDVLHVLSLPFRVKQLWPLVLIGVGLYVMWRRWRSPLADERAPDVPPDFHLVTPSLFNPPTGRLPGSIEPTTSGTPSLSHRPERRGS